MSKRRVFLERTLADGSTDPFAHYCLAQEYRALGRIEDAFRIFTVIRDRFPGYLASYLMAAQLFHAQGQREEAAEWCRAGIEKAKAARDTHTTSELEALLVAVTGA